ncbi:hypothetical protein EDB84DRAFT_402310 [Lactarius hengduanensis]|nr:hypothetical protein EDB84DRAFT_402310 [Lactarius hengduanensis]
MGIALNDEILLSIFNYYRLDEENAWNVRLGWSKLTHVCQRWRYIIYESATHLGLHILCTNGTPNIVETLGHLPPLPVFVSYQHTNVNIWEGDKSGIYDALHLRGRVRRIDLHLPPSILHKSLMLMDGPFPRLEHLSLSVTADKITTIILPKTFLAPNLRRLVLSGVGLPKGLRSLSSTSSLVTLVLKNIRAFGYLFPSLLVARLQSLPQLEELSIGFSVPIPRLGAEGELLSTKQGTPVTLPKLKTLGFQGVSAYLECLVAQIRAPLLERLDIALFYQLAFTLPLLSHFVITEPIELESARVSFGRDAVSIIIHHRHVTERYGELLNDGNFVLRVTCKQLDWQIDCAAQVCNTLMPALSGVEDLALDFHERMMPTEWHNGGIDGTTWHELLRPFIGVTRLYIYGTLSEELSRALQVDEIGSDPGFLPCLRELASFFEEAHPYSLFDSFIRARLFAGRPVSSSFRLLSSSHTSIPNSKVRANLNPFPLHDLLLIDPAPSCGRVHFPNLPKPSG